MLDQLMARVNKSVGQPVAYSLTEWDARATSVRTDESSLGDFIADVLLYSVERSLRTQKLLDAPVSRHGRAADCCLICGGSLRGDAVFGPGEITLANILEVMPFEDPIVVKELTGQQLWDALENGFSAYPKQEGRFPQVAGMRVVWDSSKEPFHRVVSVDLLHLPFDGNHTSNDTLRMRMRDQYHFVRDEEADADDVVTVHRAAAQVKEPLRLDKTYSVVTRGYLTLGNDGYTALTQGNFIMDYEAGELMATIVRKYLLGASYILRWKQLRERMLAEADANRTASGPTSADSSFDTSFQHHLSSKTGSAVQRAYELAHTPKRQRSRQGTPLVVDSSPAAIRDALYVAAHEHHSSYDTASRTYTRAPLVDNVSVDTKAVEHESRQGTDNLAVVMTLADGRMVDQARSKKSVVH